MSSINRREVLKAAGVTAVSVALAPAVVFADNDSLIATTMAGKIRGRTEEGIHVFKGVRYGADTAMTRFQAPRAPQPWSGVIAFARSGNPNNPLLPQWPAYDVKSRAAMVFDLKPEVVNDVRGTERRLFDAMKMGANG